MSDLDAIRARYQRALDAKPSKGPFTDAGIAALCDSVGDIPELLRAIDRARDLHQDEGESQGYSSDGSYTMLPSCCGTCGEFGEYGVPYPCFTRRALDGVE